MESFFADSPTGHRSASDEEASSYATVSSAPPKRRAGRTKFKETRHPVYKGVRRRNADKWVCEVREPNKKSRIWLGTFPTADMAARAHDVAAMALRGRSACLNFADSAWLLPAPKSASPKDIQRAAQEAAEAFRPREAMGAIQNGAATMESTQGEDSGVKYGFGSEEFYFPSGVEGGDGGLMMSPPRWPWPGSDDGCSSGSSYLWDDLESSTDVSLWDYSF